MKDDGRLLWGIALVAYLSVLFFLLAHFLYVLWPPVSTADTQVPAASIETGVPATDQADPEEADEEASFEFLWGSIDFKASAEEQFLLLVMVVAAIGSYVPTAMSLAGFWGNRSFRQRWVPWYLLRAPIGVALGLVFYFVIRGGLLTGESSITDANPFGILAIAAMAGMFSHEAAEKLKQVFDAALGTGKAPSSDAMITGPIIKSIEPAAVPAGVDVKVVIKGSDFAAAYHVRVNLSDRTPIFVSDEELQLELLASDLVAGSDLLIEVFDPQPGGIKSNTWTLKVT